MGRDIIPFGFYPMIGAMGVPLCTKIIILKLFSLLRFFDHTLVNKFLIFLNLLTQAPKVGKITLKGATHVFLGALLKIFFDLIYDYIVLKIFCDYILILYHVYYASMFFSHRNE